MNERSTRAAGPIINKQPVSHGQIELRLNAGENDSPGGGSAKKDFQKKRLQGRLQRYTNSNDKDELDAAIDEAEDMGLDNTPEYFAAVEASDRMQNEAYY